MSTAVSYARYSSDNQREESVTAQLRCNREFADKKGISILKEYSDEAKSASYYTTKKRDEFDNMIDDIYYDRIKPDYVIFYKVDRFARNDYDFAITKWKLRKKGVKYLYARQEIPEGPEGILVERLYEGIAEWYSANLSQDVKRGMRENALAAKHRGGIPPLGYGVDKETGKYYIIESEAAIVQTIFTMAKNGSSYPEIAAYLNSLGCKSKIGRPFSKTSIHTILRNPKYGGHYVAGRYTQEKDLMVLEGVLPAIIEPGLWKEVQNMLDNRRHVFGKPKPGGQVYLLTGKLVCGECGAAYTGSSRLNGKKRTRYSVYTCAAKRKKECDNKDIQKELLEYTVLDKIEELFAEENTERLIDLVMEKNQANTQESQMESKRLAEALVEIQKKMDNLLNAIEAGMDARIAGPRLNTLNQEKEQYERRLIEIQSSAPVFDREMVRLYIKQNQQVLNDRSDMLACKKLIDRYIVKITLLKDDLLYDIKIPRSQEEKVVSMMVDPRVSVRQTRPAPRSEYWINKFVKY